MLINEIGRFVLLVVNLSYDSYKYDTHIYILSFIIIPTANVLVRLRTLTEVSKCVNAKLICACIYNKTLYSAS